MTSMTSAPRFRRRILLVSCLAVGTIASLGLMVANSWVPLLDWAAVVVALAAGFIATWAALVEFREWRAAAQAEAIAAHEAERDRTRGLHETQRRVLTTVDARIRAIAGTLGETRAELDATKEELVCTKVSLSQAHQQVARLRGDNQALRVENTGLRHQLAAAVAATGSEAEVFTLPRRRATRATGEFDAAEPSVVVDLDLQRLAQPFVAELQARHAN